MCSVLGDTGSGSGYTTPMTSRHARRGPNAAARRQPASPWPDLDRPLMPRAGALSLSELSDGRLYTPDPWPLRTTNSTIARVRIPERKRVRAFSFGNTYAPTLRTPVFGALPKNTLVCVRRKIRKEVILATGKGGSKRKRPRFNKNSHIRCK